MAKGDILKILTFGLAGLFLPKKPPDPVQKIAIRNTVEPRRRGYGRYRASSVLAELKVQNPTGDGILHSASMFHSGEIDGIEEHKYNDQVVRIDEGTGQVIYPGVWNDSSRVFLSYHLGTDAQTADAFLTAAFPGRWTAEHRLRGIAYTVGRFSGVPLEDFSTVYQAGEPKYAPVIRASLVYDPRDPYHDPEDPTTWEWSQNAALVILDYVRHRDGMRQPWALVAPAIDDWIAAADICDEEVDLIGGGTEPRYRLSNEYEMTEPRKDILKKMEDCCDGFVYFKEDASISIQVGQFETPTLAETFSDTDILDYIGLRRGPRKSDMVNDVRAKYTSPGHDFQEQEADAWRDEDSITLDGQETDTLDLTWSPSHSQARRIMKVNAYRLNPEWSGTIVTNARGLNLLNKRYARFIISDLEIDETFFIKAADIDLLTGACTFEVVSFPAEAFEWAATEEGESPEFETPGSWGIVVPDGVTSVTITADGGGGGGSGFDGGGGGARAVITRSIDPADIGQVILFTIGAGGFGDPPNVGASTDGGDTTVAAILVSGAINLFAGGGKSGFNGDAGGIATGGDVNTNGDDAAGGNGGEGGSGASENEFPGGGGHEGVDGADGMVTFDWTYA